MDRKNRTKSPLSPLLLAVEGNDECNFFEALLRRLGVAGVQLIDFGGKDQFPVELPLLTQTDGFRAKVTAIGFVRDAENNQAARAFQSICHTLKVNRLPVPPAMNSCIPGPPRTGVFIMPDNRGAGMLETLCLQTLSGQPVERCMDDYLTCLDAIRKPDERERFNEPKARVQAYLASRAPIVNSLGLGALKHYWDFDHSCFEQIKQFLRVLFA